MENTVVYIHGQGGSPDEAKHYAPLFAGAEVIGLPYRAQTPWDAAREFPTLLDAIAGDRPVTLVANSIGAYFAMGALSERRIARAFFISPVVDMESLIGGMMAEARVSERELREKGRIPTASGQELSWEYLSYVRAHPIRWSVPTHILYGECDRLVAFPTVSDFARRVGATLTVMKGGEHWFHTEEQMRFLAGWLTGILSR